MVYSFSYFISSSSSFSSGLGPGGEGQTISVTCMLLIFYVPLTNTDPLWTPSLNTGSFMEHRCECFGDHSKVGGVGEISTKECQCGKCSLAWLLLTLFPLSFHWWCTIQPLAAGICLFGGQVVKQLKPGYHLQCPLWKFLHPCYTKQWVWRLYSQSFAMFLSLGRSKDPLPNQGERH